ncbi:carboxypeptidase regulatory-like domain-containing protein [Acidobacteriota bacterium]
MNKSRGIIAAVILMILLHSISAAQTQTSSLKGQILNSEGEPIERVVIYLDSPQMMTARFFTTPKSGKFDFELLPAGTYSLQLENPEYKFTKVENLKLRYGQTMRIVVRLEPSDSEEEITVVIPSRVIDPHSQKSAVTIDRKALDVLPLKRNLLEAVKTAPNVLQDLNTFPQTQIISGSTARSNLYTLDGLSLNDPTGRQIMTQIGYDLIEEIEVVAAGHSQEIGMADGGYINIISQTGNNPLYYSLFLQHSSEGLNNLGRTDEEIQSSQSGPPSLDKTLWDLSFTWSGALWPDRIWFFSSFSWNYNIRTTPFVSWIDPDARVHQPYDWKNDAKSIFAKLTTKPYSPFKGSFSFYFSNRYQLNTSPLLAWNLSSEATRILDNERHFLMNGYIAYEVNENTSVMLNAGYIENRSPYLVHAAQEVSPWIQDDLLGYSWGSAPYSDYIQNKRFQARARATNFVSSSSGFDMLLKAGAEYEFVQASHDIWKENNLGLYYLNANPYYFGTQISPGSGEIVGTGKIGMNFAGASSSSLLAKNDIRRISLFVSDIITLANRVTLNLGLRFDRNQSNQPSVSSSGSGSGIIHKIGEDLIHPIIGTNPFTGIGIPEWKSGIVWNTLSPRVGLVVDLFGSGRTLLKGSYARYRESPSLELLNSLNILDIENTYQFYWYDDNMNREVDPDDTYGLFPDDYRLFTEDKFKERVNTKLSAPYTTEISFSINHELTTDLTFSLTGIQKEMKNIIGNVRMDLDTGQYWYTTDHDTEGWWIPFSTIVPGGDGFTDTPVTVYYPSTDAPLFFEQVTNVPEFARKYRALEFSLSKRFSHGWMFSGSLTLSESTGNIDLGYASYSSLSSTAINPNTFVNRSTSSRLDYDRPVIIKVMSAFQFPWGFTLSAYFRHMSGAPWSRTVTVVPPSDWAQANNAYTLYTPVLLEAPASYRLKAVNILDLRLEKTFMLGGKSRLGIFVDVYNALGDTFDEVLLNDGGFWYPTAQNTSSGSRLISSQYNRTVAMYGTKTFRLSLRLGF